MVLEINMMTKMKKYSVLIIVLLIVCGTTFGSEDLSAQLTPLLHQYNTIQNKLDTIEYHIESINNHLDQVQQNTYPTQLSLTDNDEWGNLLLSFISACGALLTFYELRRKHYKSTIRKKAQGELLKKTIQQLYFNKSIIQAIILKMEQIGWDKYYPSEEILLRLKVMPNDLLFEDFEDQSLTLLAGSELKFKIRNYNSDIDVFCQQMKDSHIPTNFKRRDLDAIDFKIGQLASNMISMMYNIGIRADNKKDRESMLLSIEDFVKNTRKKQQKEIMQHEPQRDFNYAEIYQPRLDYQTKTIVEHNWDPSLTSCRFFFDKNRAINNNSYYLNLSDILDWDIQYILDPNTVPETIRVLSYKRNPKSFK